MKVKSHEIKHALSKKHYDDFFLTEVKNGPTHTASELLIMDALAIKKSWANPCITGYEVKVSRSDFLRDEKWPAYKDQCHRFSFVCPKDLIRPEELPEDVGLIWYNPEKLSLYTRRKAVYRDVEMNAEMFYYIIMNRLENERHPFFSDQRELIEEFIADKGARYKLAHGYKHKLARQTEEADKRAKDAERELQKHIDKAEKFDKMVEIMKANGVRYHPWSWEDDLSETLKSGLSPQIEKCFERIESEFERVKEFRRSGS